ncbi:MAG: hypothetical protein A2857_04905 [Candidatus Levybacteria bacterium RIFCSPHIGHO2_01_FULL_36_15]|nr:MAG: hypothetical protein A2857_04905 [Candidatus Levybacteria bacterium RIFCSPHIGHO2_01_FULL_36_15]OGH38569.1 MAG: hypothetical protein A2905_03985 [Candidatus Levybacteria bacterium RIFCSPLOWO2_01_FULL_36_10]
MSKTLLRIIAEKTEQQVEQFNKNNEAQARYGGTKVSKLNTEQQEAYEKAVESGDIKKVTELLDLGITTPTELYLNMPDLKVSDSGSIRSLSVYVYSAEANDEVLLHKLFSKVREQT